MAAYNIYEAKTKFSALVEKAANGEEVVIAKAGRPLLKLVPVMESHKEESRFRRPLPGFAKGEFHDLIEEMDKPWPEEVLRAFGMFD